MTTEVSRAHTKLLSFLDRTTDQLYFCRGPQRCTKNDRTYRKLRCTDCVLGREQETLEELMARMERADA